jgi:hypothetical protein
VQVRVVPAILLATYSNFNFIKMSKVIVTANAEGSVVSLSKNNPEYGYVRVEQVRGVVDDRGWVSKKTLSALMYGKAEDLLSLGYFKGQALAGKIVIKESLEPFNTENPEKDYKIAGKSGIICCQDGQPIYRKCFYTTNEAEGDTLIVHNNTESIREAMLTADETVSGFNL